MKTTSMVILTVFAVGLAGAAIYFSRKQQTNVRANSGPVNSLPARAYALNPNYNPQAQPPTPTFTPFSGAPVVESLLRGFQSPSSGSTAQPVSYDTTDTSSTTVSDSGTTTYWG